MKNPIFCDIKNTFLAVTLKLKYLKFICQGKNYSKGGNFENKRQLVEDQLVELLPSLDGRD